MKTKKQTLLFILILSLFAFAKIPYAQAQEEISNNVAQSPAVEILAVTAGNTIEQQEAHCREVVGYREVIEQVPTRIKHSTVRDRRSNSNDGWDSVAGELIGGAAGGILGGQFGKGNGKTAAAVGGAIIGTMTGRRLVDNRKVSSHSSRNNRRTTYVLVQEEIVETVPCTKDVRISGHRVQFRVANGDIQEVFVPRSSSRR